MAETTTHFLPRSSERVFRLLLPLLCYLLLADSYKDRDASESLLMSVVATVGFKSRESEEFEMLKIEG